MGWCLSCKQPCNDPHCTCRPPPELFISVPASFNPSPCPTTTSDRQAPQPQPQTAGTAGARPAGRPPGANSTQPVRVAAATEFPDVTPGTQERIERAEAVRVALLEEETEENRSESHSPSKPPGSIIIDVWCNGVLTRALCDTGSQADLMSEQLAKRAQILVRPLINPVKVDLAIETENKTPNLTHFCFANVLSKKPEIRFGATFFRMAKLSKDYDLILGLPFL